jgi:anti-anti-sigma factor
VLWHIYWRLKANNFKKVMQMFQRQIAKDYVIHHVNLSQATYAEAMQFRKILELDVELGYRTLIVDLSNCNSLDSAFIGVLVVVLKKLMRMGGSLKILKPDLFTNSILNLTGTIEIFEIYESLELAISSIYTHTKTDESFAPTGLDQLAIAH